MSQMRRVLIATMAAYTVQEAEENLVAQIVDSTTSCLPRAGEMAVKLKVMNRSVK